MKYNFSITKNPNPKAKPDPDTLRFGTEFTDHMFIMDYQEGSFLTARFPLILQLSFSTMLRLCSRVSRLTRLLKAECSFSDLT